MGLEINILICQILHRQPGADTVQIDLCKDRPENSVTPEVLVIRLTEQESER